MGYNPDLSVFPPVPADSFSKSTSIPVSVSSLPGKTPVEYEFDFTNNPIPVGITDLYLEIRYTGTEGALVAAGMKDLFEPVHVSVFNNTDHFYLDHVLRTASEIRSGYQDRVDFDSPPNGIINECWKREPYVDPVRSDIRLSFFSGACPAPAQPASIDDYLASFIGVPAERHVKLILLTGTNQFYTWIDIRAPEGELPQGCTPCPLQFRKTWYSVYDQGDPTLGEFRYADIVSWRGVREHYYHPIFLASYPSDRAGMEKAQWPELQELNPFPVTSIKP